MVGVGGTVAGEASDVAVDISSEMQNFGPQFRSEMTIRSEVTVRGEILVRRMQFRAAIFSEFFFPRARTLSLFRPIWSCCSRWLRFWPIWCARCAFAA